MRKSLVPLIISLSGIVLLTAIIINFKPDRNVDSFDGGKAAAGPRRTIYLSNNGARPKPNVQPYRPKNFTLDAEASRKMLYQAYSQLDKGNVSDAEEKVKTVLVFEPDNAEALSLLGKIYYLQHKYNEAELVFRKQVKLNKKSASAYNNLGQVLLKQKRSASAVALLLKAQALDPKSGLIALNLSGAYSREGKKDEAIDSFKKAFKLLGSRIITVANHPDLDNVRNEKEFKEIMRKAYKDLSEKQKAIEKARKEKKQNNEKDK